MNFCYFYIKKKCLPFDTWNQQTEKREKHRETGKLQKETITTFYPCTHTHMYRCAYIHTHLKKKKNQPNTDKKHINYFFLTLYKNTEMRKSVDNC